MLNLNNKTNMEKCYCNVKNNYTCIKHCKCTLEYTCLMHRPDYNHGYIGMEIDFIKNNEHINTGDIQEILRTKNKKNKINKY